MQELLANILILFQLVLGQTPYITPKESPAPKTQEVILEEAQSPEKSNREDWWLNSGGQVILREGTIQTLQGESRAETKWHSYYKSTSPNDTDNGTKPQNLFRLVSKTEILNGSQEGTITINKYNTSQSENRNQSNGVFFMTRYIDGNNLYYIGIRVDGNAIIKRKRNGLYTTLVQKKIFEGNYDRNKAPNILPINTPISIRGSVQNIDNNVELKLERKNDGVWEEIIKVIDSSGDKIVEPGRYGIRSDFMDMEVMNYSLTVVN